MHGTVEIKSKTQLLQEMINYVVARTALTDLLPASVLTQILGAAAQSDEALYLQVAKLIEMFSIRRARGQNLRLRAYDYNTEAGGPQYAVATGYFTRTLAAATPLTLAAGTIVASSGGIKFATLVGATIPGAGTQSPAVGIIAVQPGVAGNLATGAVTTVVSAYSGAGTEGLAFVSDSPSVGGADTESDAALLQRLYDIAAALNRTSPRSTESVARLTALATGERVQTAKSVDDISDPGRGTLYIDNGTGTTATLEVVGTFAGAPVAAEVLIASAAGGESRFWLAVPPVARNSGNTPMITLYRNTVTALLVGVHFHIISGTGELVLDSTLFPTGLAAADRLEAVYTSWSGLIREVQRRLSGWGADAVAYPGGFAGGSHITVRSPEIYRPVIDVSVAVGASFTVATVKAAVKDALLAYINTLAIGQDIVLAELYDVAMDVDGVTDFLVVSPAPAAPAANIAVADTQLVRLSATDITGI